MDRQKKKELAQKDSRWNFEKTVKAPRDASWDKIRQEFNNLQDNHGDLYMNVCKMPKPSKLEKVKMWANELLLDYSSSITFHHSQIFNWFETLANHLDLTVGETIYKVMHEKEDLREELDLGETMNVEINSVSEMEAPSESKVSKEELEEMVNTDD